MFYIKKKNEEFVAQRADEIVKKLRAEFGALGRAEDDTTSVVAAKCKRILELVPSDIPNDDADGLTNRQEILWRARKEVLAPLDALLQFDWDIAAHGTGVIFVCAHGRWQKTEL